MVQQILKVVSVKPFPLNDNSSTSKKRAQTSDNVSGDAGN